MVADEQIPQRFRDVINEQIEIHGDKRSITLRNSIPDTTEIPIENQSHWLKIPNVICIYVDMKGSTQLSAEAQEASTAGAYQLFTGTAVRLFSAFEAPYIDISGDAVFALFDSSQPFRSLAAAVTFKTFAQEEFVPRIQKQTEVEIGTHMGIDQRTVLVRKIGFKRYRGRTDRQNEVWAGKPVNMAAKLAALSENKELLVSERYFQNIQDELAIMSCGCQHTSTGRIVGEKKELWEKVDVSEDERFDFDTAYRLASIWCDVHGVDYCEAILALDKE